MNNAYAKPVEVLNGRGRVSIMYFYDILQKRYYSGFSKDNKLEIQLYISHREPAELIIFKDGLKIIEFVYDGIAEYVSEHMCIILENGENTKNKRVDILDASTLAINIRNIEGYNERVILYYDRDKMEV